MRNGFSKYLITLYMAAVLGLFVASAQPSRAEGIVSGHVLVRTNAGVDIQRLIADYHVSLVDSVPGTNLYSLSLPAKTSETTFAALLSKDARVLFAEPDRFVTSPEVRGEPFHFAFDFTATPKTYVNSVSYTQVNLGKADAFGQAAATALATGKGIVIAVLDTGATFGHPDLKTHYVPGYNALSPGSLPLDIQDGATNNEVGHGTMVAGIIARLAPQAQIMPVRVMDGDGKGTILELIKGIDYAVTHGARVLNMSFGTSNSSGALNDALDRAELAGIVLVASAGNDNANQPSVPAIGRGSLAVGAVEGNNTKSPYSNFGSFVRVVAPGSNIRSAYWNGGYATWSGTSFAAPFVAAQAALILSKKPAYTADQVKDAIRGTARSVDKVNPSYKGQLGKGIIDIEASVKAAR